MDGADGAGGHTHRQTDTVIHTYAPKASASRLLPNAWRRPICGNDDMVLKKKVSQMRRASERVSTHNGQTRAAKPLPACLTK